MAGDDGGRASNGPVPLREKQDKEAEQVQG